MKKILFMIVLLWVNICCISSFAVELDPLEILKKVEDTYKSMETYKSQGTRTVVTESDNQKNELLTSYSILLKKPNLYRIYSETTFSMGGK